MVMLAREQFRAVALQNKVNQGPCRPGVGKASSCSLADPASLVYGYLAAEGSMITAVPMISPLVILINEPSSFLR